MDPSHINNLPNDALIDIFRKMSVFPRRSDWISFITPEHIFAILERNDALSEVARSLLTGIHTNHEEPLAEIFDTGTLHARTGVNLVSIPEHVHVLATLFERIFSKLSAHHNRQSSLQFLDLDHLQLSESIVALEPWRLSSIQTIGMRHFCHNSWWAQNMMSQSQNLRELFLSECEIGPEVSEAIASTHGGHLELLSLARVSFMGGACEEPFWKAVGPNLRELVYVGNDYVGAESRWKGIGDHCKNLKVLRFEHFDADHDWYNAWADMLQTSVNSPTEMWYRTLPHTTGIRPYAADETMELSQVIHEGREVMMHERGLVYLHGGRLVFVPKSPTNHTVIRDVPQGVEVTEFQLEDHFFTEPDGSGFPRAMEAYTAPSPYDYTPEPFVRYHLAPFGAIDARDCHRKETEAFEKAIESIGEGLDKIYLYKWYGDWAKTSTLLDSMPRTQVHLDLTNARPHDVLAHTGAVGPLLVELQLPPHPDLHPTQYHKLSPLCTNLTHLSVWKGPYEEPSHILLGSLRALGPNNSITHLHYRIPEDQLNQYPHEELSEDLEVIRNNLWGLRKLVVECGLISLYAFDGLGKVCRELREVCIRVFEPVPGPHPMRERLFSDWIRSFASLPHIRAIAIEQRTPNLEGTCFVRMDEMREWLKYLRPRRDLHIQVFSQPLFD